jgi:hypothetical protein
VAQNTWIDYYSVLGISRTASPQKIKKAYKKLIKENHPDTHPNDSEATAKTAQINEAYSTLSDSSKKATYDSEYDRRAATQKDYDTYSQAEQKTAEREEFKRLIYEELEKADSFHALFQDLCLDAYNGRILPQDYQNEYHVVSQQARDFLRFLDKLITDAMKESIIEIIPKIHEKQEQLKNALREVPKTYDDACRQAALHNFRISVTQYVNDSEELCDKMHSLVISAGEKTITPEIYSIEARCYQEFAQELLLEADAIKRGIESLDRLSVTGIDELVRELADARGNLSAKAMWLPLPGNFETAVFLSLSVSLGVDALDEFEKWGYIEQYSEWDKLQTIESRIERFFELKEYAESIQPFIEEAERRITEKHNEVNVSFDRIHVHAKQVFTKSDSLHQKANDYFATVFPTAESLSVAHNDADALINKYSALFLCVDAEKSARMAKELFAIFDFDSFLKKARAYSLMLNDNIEFFQRIQAHFEAARRLVALSQKAENLVHGVGKSSRVSSDEKDRLFKLVDWIRREMGFVQQDTGSESLNDQFKLFSKCLDALLEKLQEPLGVETPQPIYAPLQPTSNTRRQKPSGMRQSKTIVSDILHNNFFRAGVCLLCIFGCIRLFFYIAGNQFDSSPLIAVLFGASVFALCMVLLDVSISNGSFWFIVLTVVFWIDICVINERVHMDEDYSGSLFYILQLALCIVFMLIGICLALYKRNHKGNS